MAFGSKKSAMPLPPRPKKNHAAAPISTSAATIPTASPRLDFFGGAATAAPCSGISFMGYHLFHTFYCRIPIWGSPAIDALKVIW